MIHRRPLDTVIAEDLCPRDDNGRHWVQEGILRPRITGPDTDQNLSVKIFIRDIELLVSAI